MEQFLYNIIIEFRINIESIESNLINALQIKHRIELKHKIKIFHITKVKQYDLEIIKL